MRINGRWDRLPATNFQSVIEWRQPLSVRRVVTAPVLQAQQRAELISINAQRTLLAKQKKELRMAMNAIV